MPPARPRFAPRKPGQPSVGRRRGVPAPGASNATEPAALMSEEEISELIASILGRELKVVRSDPPDGAGTGPVVVNAYCSDSGEVGAVLVAELGLAAAISAALTSAETTVMSAAVQAGLLEGELLEDWTEVAKVCAQLIRLPGATPLSLSQTVQSATQIPGDLERTLDEAAMKVCWTMTVPGYGAGRLSAVWMKPG